jgi:hypothetical protein
MSDPGGYRDPRGYAEPREAGTVPVRVQVVDTAPRVIDPTVPTYLDAADLTQRIARDAGLGGWWEDGTRRGFGLWARGRLVQAHERLADANVVPYELLHLLPEPRRGAGIQERPLGLTETGDAPSRATRFFRLVWALAWLALWSVAIDTRPGPAVAWTGAFVTPILVLGAVRGFTWGSPTAWPAAWGVAGTMVATSLPLAIGLSAAPEATRWVVGVSALLGLAVGACAAWLIWLGPMPLPAVDEAKPQVAYTMVAACGICGGAVTSDVVEPCVHGCGRTFHRGCLRARESVSQGPGCAVCGAVVRPV